MDVAPPLRYQIIGMAIVHLLPAVTLEHKLVTGRVVTLSHRCPVLVIENPFVSAARPQQPCLQAMSGLADLEYAITHHGRRPGAAPAICRSPP